MKTYYLKNQNNQVNNTRLTKKSQLLKLINEKYIDALELAIASEDIRRIHNIINNFSLEIYKATGIWYDEFDYYDEYSDNLNGYISLLIHRINEAFQ